MVRDTVAQAAMWAGRAGRSKDSVRRCFHETVEWGDDCFLVFFHLLCTIHVFWNTPDEHFLPATPSSPQTTVLLRDAEQVTSVAFAYVYASIPVPSCVHV